MSDELRGGGEDLNWSLLYPHEMACEWPCVQPSNIQDKSMEKLNKGKQESSLNRVCVVFACLHRDTFWGWETDTIFLSLFITKILRISRTSTTPNPGENPACHTHTNELSEISGFRDSCVDKHNLPQAPLIPLVINPAFILPFPYRIPYDPGYNAEVRQAGDSSCVTPCSPWAVAGAGTTSGICTSWCTGAAALLFRAIDFLPFLVKHSVNWKQLKVNGKDFVKRIF